MKGFGFLVLVIFITLVGLFLFQGKEKKILPLVADSQSKTIKIFDSGRPETVIFALTNTNDSKIVISEVIPSCSCFKISLSNKEIPPFGRAFISVGAAGGLDKLDESLVVLDKKGRKLLLNVSVKKVNLINVRPSRHLVWNKDAEKLEPKSIILSWPDSAQLEVLDIKCFKSDDWKAIIEKKGNQECTIKIIPSNNNILSYGKATVTFKSAIGNKEKVSIALSR